MPDQATDDLKLDAAQVGRSAMRKATLRLIPLLALGYGSAYMDRVNISFAALQMNRDLHFSSTIYNFGAGLFFLSYAVCEIPSNLLLLRFRARRWMARIMLSWGILAIAMMFVRTPIQFYVVRFLLGMAEAGFFPGVIFYLMQWFPAEMRARTITRFYISLPLSSVFMGSLAGMLLNLQGKFGLAGWQWLFAVEGLPALALSLIFLLFLPSDPGEAKWLSAAERRWIVDSLRRENEGVANVQSLSTKAKGKLSVLRDARVWLMGTFYCCMLGSTYGYTFSAPILIQQITGLSATKVGLIVASTGLLGAASMLINALHSDRQQERYWHVIVPCLSIAAAFFVGGTFLTAAVALPAFALIVISHNSMQGPALAVPGEFLHGNSAAVGFAAMNMIGMVGGFVGPYWMGLVHDHTGDYRHGLMGLALPMLVAAGIMAYLRMGAVRTARVIRQQG
jgi:MFS transporter, ACS family, tartrate transporter